MAAAFSVVMLVGLYSKFVAQKWYRATAIIEPTPYSSAGEFASVFAGRAADLSWFFGEPGKTETIAHEYIAILSSFTFQVGLARRHHITLETLGMTPAEIRRLAGEREKQWTLYRELSQRFNASYSFRAGNLTLSFLDTDPRSSAEILGYFIDDLRERLRLEEVAHRRTAASTLESEIRASNDPVLIENLYSLMAREIERQKLAQVAADFNFRLLAPPVAPDRRFQPKVSTNCLLAAFFALVILGSGAAMHDFLVVFRTRQRDAEVLALELPVESDDKPEAQPPVE